MKPTLVFYGYHLCKVLKPEGKSNQLGKCVVGRTLYLWNYGLGYTYISTYTNRMAPRDSSWLEVNRLQITVEPRNGSALRSGLHDPPQMAIVEIKQGVSSSAHWLAFHLAPMVSYTRKKTGLQVWLYFLHYFSVFLFSWNSWVFSFLSV